MIVLAIIAITDTATMDIPKTGIPVVDKYVGMFVVAVFALTALSSYLAMLFANLRASLAVAKKSANDLFVAVKAMTWGVEVSTEDIADLLIAAEIEEKKAKALAVAIHKLVTQNIKEKSNSARVEPVVNKIVKETKSEMKTYMEGGRASVMLLALAAIVAFLACSLNGCATAPKEYVDADASYYSVTKPIIDEVMKRQPKEHAERTKRVQDAKEFQIRQAGGEVPIAPPPPRDFFDGVFAVPLAPTGTAKPPGEEAIR